MNSTQLLQYFRLQPPLARGQALIAQALIALVVPAAGCIVEQGSPEVRSVERQPASEPALPMASGGEARAAHYALPPTTDPTDLAAPATDEDWSELSTSLSRGTAVETASTEGEVQAAGALFGGAEAIDNGTEWMWIPDAFLPETPVCMDGSATGLGVSLVEGAEKTVVYFQDGGACFNGTTCALSTYWLTNERFDDESFESWSTETGQLGIFDRTQEDNPYRDYNIVLLPYCSGDIFAGDNWHGPGGRVHVGYRNVGIYLDFLQDYLWDQSAWTVMGSSAGGFGAAWNFSRVQAQVAPAPVALVSDAAPIFSSTYATTCLQEKWKNAWSLDHTTPPEFTGTIGFKADGSEGEGLGAMFSAIVDEHAQSRFAFIAGNEDTVLRFFFGIGHSWGCNLPWLMSKRAYRAAVDDVYQTMHERENFSLYIVPTTDHMFLNNSRLYTTTVSELPLTEWLGEFAAGGQPANWW